MSIRPLSDAFDDGPMRKRPRTEPVVAHREPEPESSGYTYPCCNTCDDEKLSFCCDFCDSWWHEICLLQKFFYSSAALFTMKTSAAKFQCPKCKTAVQSNPSYGMMSGMANSYRNQEERPQPSSQRQQLNSYQQLSLQRQQIQRRQLQAQAAQLHHARQRQQMEDPYSEQLQARLSQQQSALLSQHRQQLSPQQQHAQISARLNSIMSRGQNAQVNSEMTQQFNPQLNTQQLHSRSLMNMARSIVQRDEVPRTLQQDSHDQFAMIGDEHKMDMQSMARGSQPNPMSKLVRQPTDPYRNAPNYDTAQMLYSRQRSAQKETHRQQPVRLHHEGTTQQILQPEEQHSNTPEEESNHENEQKHEELSTLQQERAIIDDLKRSVREKQKETEQQNEAAAEQKEPTGSQAQQVQVQEQSETTQLQENESIERPESQDVAVSEVAVSEVSVPEVVPVAPKEGEKEETVEEKDNESKVDLVEPKEDVYKFINSIEEKTEAELNALKSKENILTNDSQQEP